MKPNNQNIFQKLRVLAHKLINPLEGVVAIEPAHAGKGFWFGSGKAAVGSDGRLYLCGRYRDAGDSRTGLDLGDRGRELAIFSTSLPLPAELRSIVWKKELALDKTALAVGNKKVLSIEGSALQFTEEGVCLFVSSEKAVDYPPEVAEFRKPGTGVWTIEQLSAADIQGLATSRARTILESSDPATLHLKDPFLARAGNGDNLLFFCHHPFNWASSGTGYATLDRCGRLSAGPVYDCWPRGRAWDVAITRGTCALRLPAAMALPGFGLAFYDGGECLRNLDEHSKAVSRPRGYSCEELGGLAYFCNDDPTQIERISAYLPEFISPAGSGCIRYADVVQAGGQLIATWQQARADGSQPLMINAVETDSLFA